LEIVDNRLEVNSTKLHEKIPDWILFSASLYNRCSIFGTELALPQEGGVLDQSEMIVSILEIIHEEVLKFRAQRARDAEFFATQRSNKEMIDRNVTRKTRGRR